MNLTPGGNEYAVHPINFPPSVLAAVVALGDGTFDIFINDALSPELRQKALEHELRHIDNGHLQNDVYTIEEMEREADGLDSGRLPNVFRDRPASTIPYFSSLNAFRDYIWAMAAQDRKDRGLK